MRARSNDRKSIVYSTEAPAHARTRPAAPARAATGHGVVRIWLEKKGRNGTPVSILRGVPGDHDALVELASRLKRACGTGGSAKDGEIIIQGDHRDRIAALLEGEGLRVKLAGG
jgi:translation initiation factor 1